jgi:hypothetical protein
MKEKALFTCRIEELPFVVVFLLISLKRDKALFKAYAPTYDDAFIASIEAQATAVKARTSPKSLTGEMKSLTKLVAADYKSVRDMINHIETILESVTVKLTMGVEDFGVRAVREELYAKNDEGIVLQLRTLFKNVENNSVELEKEGYTPALSEEFEKLIDTLGEDSTTQTTKKDDRKYLTQGNIKEGNKLWALISKVMKTGKKIAKQMENDSMHDDYTFNNILKKVRLEHNTKDSGDSPPATDTGTK